MLESFEILPGLQGTNVPKGIEPTMTRDVQYWHEERETDPTAIPQRTPDKVLERYAREKMALPPRRFMARHRKLYMPR